MPATMWLAQPACVPKITRQIAKYFENGCSGSLEFTRLRGYPDTGNLRQPTEGVIVVDPLCSWLETEN